MGLFNREKREQEKLKKIAATSPNLEDRRRALWDIKDDIFLAQYANAVHVESLVRHAVDGIKDPNVLFSLAMSGTSRDAIQLAAIKLARLGDVRAITHYDAILSRQHNKGSLGDNMFLSKILEAAANIPCEESVAFLEKNLRYPPETKYIAQNSLRAIMRTVHGTPLAERIAKIDDLSETVRFDMY